MNQVEFPHCTVIYNAPVITLVFKEGSEMDVKEARELIKAAHELSGNKPYLLFSDIRNYVKITEEARQVAADRREAPYVLANAVLTDNIALKLTANFFVKVNKPPFPVKLFTDRFKANLWLMSFDPDKDITRMLDSFKEE